MYRFLNEGDETLFKELLDKNSTGQKIDVIITFISVLELARLGKISIFQNEDNAEIYVRVVSSLENFDVREADGVDEEDGQKEERGDAELPEYSMQDLGDGELELPGEAAPEQASMNEENNIKVEEPTKTLQ